MGQNQPSSATFVLINTTDAMTINEDDQIRFWRREVGDIAWGDTFFLGFVKGVDIDDKEFEIEAKCYLGKIAGRKLLRFAWGNTEVVDKEYGVQYGHAAFRETTRIYAELDSGDVAQDPLEVLKVLRLQEYVNGGDGTDVFKVYDNGTTDVVLAQMFKAGEGILRKIWVKGYKDNVGSPPNLTVSIQAGGTEPDGTDITSHTFSSVIIPTSSGNEDWIEFDMLNNVSNPYALNLIPGSTYWIVFKIATPTLSFGYYFRIVTESEQPRKRVFKSNLLSAGWSRSPSQRSMYFGIDFEGDWLACDKMNYILQNDIDPPTIFFYKADEGAGDGQGVTYFRGQEFDVLFEGQKSIRATYWKGKMNYTTVLTKWAQAYFSDGYDTLDISITEPGNKQFVIHGENCGGMQAFNLIRQYCPIIVRVYYDSGGNVVLEVRDILEPDDWAAQPAAWKNNRTFRHGFDALANSNVRILNLRRKKRMVSEVKTAIALDGRGQCSGAAGDGGMISAGAMGVIGGGSMGDGMGFVAGAYDKIRTVASGGSMSMTGVDQTYNNGIFRNMNELVKVKSTKHGIDGEYAIQNVQWDGGVEQPTKVSLTFADVIYDVVLRVGLNDSLVDFSNGLQPFLKSYNIEPRLGDPTVGGQGSGCTDLPGIGPSLGSSTRQLNEELIHWRDDSYSYVAGKYYYISVGNSVPAPPDLGNKVAEVLANVKIVDIAGAQKAIMMVRINEADFGFNAAWPHTLTEVGLSTATSIGGAKTAVWAKSFGLPAGTFDFDQPQPVMGRDKTLCAIIIVDVP